MYFIRVVNKASSADQDADDGDDPNLQTKKKVGGWCHFGALLLSGDANLEEQHISIRSTNSRSRRHIIRLCRVTGPYCRIVAATRQQPCREGEA